MSDIDSSEVINVDDLIEKEAAEDADKLILEDSENTKQITIENLRKSMIKDNENPATDRLWSSEKINKILEDMSKTLEKGVGSVQGDIKDLEKNKISQKELIEALNDMDDKKADTIVTDTLSKELECRRSTSVPLTSKDFICTTDAEKFHLDHLGKDIIAAMTGQTEIKAATTPEGGWVTEDLADKIITGAKLSSWYRFIKSVISGNINLIIDDGLYLIGKEVSGFPKYEDDETDSKLLEVTRYGEEGKYITQKVYYIDQADSTIKRPYYFERTGETSKIHTLEFVAHFEVTDTNKVEANLLGDTYNNRGAIDSGDVYDLVSNGNYLCTKNVTNLPIENTDFLVSINSYNETIEYTAKTVEVTGGTKEFRSFIYYDSAHMPVIVPWFETATNLKSRFDGKRVHIFGDGIAYGLGASDIPNKSYANLLTSKYGYIINNHALTDATYGIYGNDKYKDKCVLTQIQLATGLDNADYAIIFAGTNDFTSGVAEIGTNLSEGTNTFKGSIIAAIEALLTTNPKIKILLVTPVYRNSITFADGHNSDETRINDKYLYEYADAIVDIGKSLHIPTTNVYEDGMINKYNYNMYLAENGIHLADGGHELICEKIHDAMCRYY